MRVRGLILMLLATGCAGQVEASIQVTPPAPAPAVATASPTALAPAAAQTDQDGDGVLDDDCPNEPETKNGFADDDGCPDEPPDFYAADQDIRYTGEFTFGLLGGLMNSSQPIIDGIAAVFAKHADIALVEVAVHVTAGSDPQDTSNRRAKAIVKALGKAGVNTERLRGVGYGKRCPQDGTRVELKIVSRADAETKVTRETGVALCGT